RSPVPPGVRSLKVQNGEGRSRAGTSNVDRASGESRKVERENPRLGARAFVIFAHFEVKPSHAARSSRFARGITHEQPTDSKSATMSLSLSDLLFDRAAREPLAPAIITPDEEISVGELATESAALAQLLTSEGFGEKRITLLLPN